MPNPLVFTTAAFGVVFLKFVTIFIVSANVWMVGLSMWRTTTGHGLKKPEMNATKAMWALYLLDHFSSTTRPIGILAISLLIIDYLMRITAS